MNVSIVNNSESTLILKLMGKIDSSNAQEIDDYIAEELSAKKYLAVIINAEKLEYISSAGLRILLRVRKAVEDLTITGVNTDVYEILDMTGFTEMIKVEKAYRQFSVEGCEVIGQGANGKVYRLDKDTIIKVYMNPDSLDDVNREREFARKAFVLGIPTAIPYDVVKVGDKYGTVFELLSATSFSKLIAKNPEKLDVYIEHYVELLKKIHETQVNEGDISNAKETALKWISDIKGKLPEDKWEKLNQLVNAVPDDLHMIHGDFHTKNIMMQNDEVLLIDMDTLSHGDIIFEFLNIFNAFIGYEETKDKEDVGDFLGLNYDLVHSIWDKIIKLYFKTEDKEFIETITKKISLLGYVRVFRRTLKRNANTEEGKTIIEHSYNKIIKLLDEVDTLAIYQ